MLTTTTTFAARTFAWVNDAVEGNRKAEEGKETSESGEASKLFKSMAVLTDMKSSDEKLEVSRVNLELYPDLLDQRRPLKSCYWTT